MKPRRTFSRFHRLLHLAVLATLLAGMIAASPAVTAQDAPLDLAAIIIHPDDLDWIVERGEIIGQLDNAPYVTDVSSGFTTIDEVIAGPHYQWGWGGVLMSEAQLVDVEQTLEETGWVRTADVFMVRMASLEGNWITGVGATIEEYESAEGAEAAFAAFNDADLLSEIGQATQIKTIDAPNLGDEAVMWAFASSHIGGQPTPVVSLRVRVGNLIVSIAALDASAITEPQPAVVEQLMELQLKRLEHAEHLYQPNLSACAPRLIGDDVVTLSDDYILLNGTAFGVWNDTYPMLEEDEADSRERGMIDRHRLRQRFDESEFGVTDGMLYYTVFTRAFIDAGHAAAYLDDADTIIAEEDDQREDITELDDVPELGDSARAFSYVGKSGSPSVVVYVQIGNLVFSIYLGPSTEPLPAPAYELAAAYSDRLASGNCTAPIPAPTGL